MTEKTEMPVVSIVGRPNVGKSSLFNRIIGWRHAVVEEHEGTTRDRIEEQVSFKEKRFKLIDTGGFLTSDRDGITSLVRKQIEKAILSSDILLIVCDGEEGLMPLDIDLAATLRKSGKKIIIGVNKVDNEKRKENIFDFYQLGLGEPFAISCLHNLGVKKFLGEMADILPDYSGIMSEKENPIKIAIAGRPNVGKSSFLNRVMDTERVIVHDLPGTTRDSIDSYFSKDGIAFLLIDTAGIRHKKKVKNAVDVYSIMRAKNSIDRSDITLLLLDGVEGVTNDDAKIFDYIIEKGRGCVILVNKWDLVKEIEISRYENAIFRKMPEARKFPVAFISAKTGRNALKVFDRVAAIKTNSEIFINSSALRAFLKEIKPENVKISRRRKIPKFYYMVEMRMFPKEFLVFTNDPSRVTHFHTSFIENRLRERFPLEGIPLRIIYRKLRNRKG